MTGGAGPAVHAFPPETLQALFEAVEIDDVVDSEVSLPDPIDPACSEEEMRRCLALCLQFWSEGVRRADLLRLTGALLREGDLDPAARAEYKHIRAKYKHLRFALTLYDARHRPPPLFGFTVATMGHLQDAFRNGHRRAVTGHALLLRVLLARPVWAAVRRRVSAVRLDTPEGFLAYRRAEIRRLAKALERESLTGPQFHAMRKIVSRHVSFYDTMRSIEPREHDRKLSRFLSAINGLMGSRHDEMVERAISGEQSYGTTTVLDADVRLRLEGLIARYPLQGASSPNSG